MDFSNLASPTVYLAILLSLLALAGVAVVVQVLKTRRIEMTLTKLQNKLTKEAGNAKEYYELGSIFLDKKVYTQAITLFQKSIKAPDLEDPDSALVYNALGFAYFAQDQFDLAIKQYKQALEIAPEYVTAWNNLGHAYERKQLVSQAVEAYETALKLEPSNSTAQRRATALNKRLAPKS
jgi:Tfp pilus assembly protein PilF